MKYGKRISAVVLSIMMILSMMPAMVFAEGYNAAEPLIADEVAAEDMADDAASEVQPADPGEAAVEESVEAAAEEAVTGEEAAVEEDFEDPDEHADDGVVYDESDVGYFEESYGEGVDAEGIAGTDPEEQVEDFLFSEEDRDEDGKAPNRVLSVKGERLTGNDLKYYNYYKKIIKEVSAGSRSNAYITVKGASFLGKRTFTASQLGVPKIGYKKNGKWYMTAAAKKKVRALFNPISWKRVYTSALSDMSNSSYWVDWYADSTFFEWTYNCSFGTSQLVFSTDSQLQFRVPVMPEFAKDASSTTVYIFKADQSKLKSAKTAKENAKYIVDRFSTDIDTSGYSPAEVDLDKLWYYCDWIAYLTEYDHEAADNEDIGRTTPWSFVSVLDGNDNTLAVCAGYARAFKYLCDLTKFNSDWIDCQVVSGDASGGSHMWNIVRMDDGLNYVVDPTWLDDGESADSTFKWFLRGAPDGTANSYTIEGSTRVYDAWVKTTFPAGERKLAEKDWYQTGLTRKISLRKPGIYAPVRGKKSFTAKWKKVTTPLGALYVDGYQIRYCVRANMSGAKKVTVKGYNKSSKTITKLGSNRYYYVQVRTYAKLGGKTYYSPWSTKKKVKTR